MILPPALGLVLNRPTAYCILLFAIKQWGAFGNVTSGTYITMPLSATPFLAVATDINTNNNPLCLSASNFAYGKFGIYGIRIGIADGIRQDSLWGQWIAVCK